MSRDTHQVETGGGHPTRHGPDLAEPPLNNPPALSFEKSPGLIETTLIVTEIQEQIDEGVPDPSQVSLLDITHSDSENPKGTKTSWVRPVIDNPEPEVPTGEIEPKPPMGEINPQLLSILVESGHRDAQTQLLHTSDSQSTMDLESPDPLKSILPQQGQLRHLTRRSEDAALPEERRQERTGTREDGKRVRRGGSHGG
jgi:hypothetical protein